VSNTIGWLVTEFPVLSSWKHNRQKNVSIIFLKVPLGTADKTPLPVGGTETTGKTFEQKQPQAEFSLA
jgi:hypothetical protein